MLERFTEENPGECTALTTDATSDSTLTRLHMLGPNCTCVFGIRIRLFQR